MRSIEEVKKVLNLHEDGCNQCQIARLTGIPRSTVKDWVLNKEFKRARLTQLAEVGDLKSLQSRFDSEGAYHYNYLLGLYLGDGHISKHPRDVYKLRIFLDDKYPGIQKECVRSLEEVIGTRVGRCQRPGCKEIYAYKKHLPLLFPQHGRGKKHLRRIILHDWQSSLVSRNHWAFLRGLIHSDGCFYSHRNKGEDKIYKYYAFSNMSLDIQHLLQNSLDELQLEWKMSQTATKNGPKYQTYIRRRSSVMRLYSHMGNKY